MLFVIPVYVDIVVARGPQLQIPRCARDDMVKVRSGDMVKVRSGDIGNRGC